MLLLLLNRGGNAVSGAAPAVVTPQMLACIHDDSADLWQHTGFTLLLRGPLPETAQAAENDDLIVLPRDPRASTRVRRIGEIADINFGLLTDRIDTILALSTGPAGADGRDGTNGTNGADGADGVDGAGLPAQLVYNSANFDATTTTTLATVTGLTVNLVSGKTYSISVVMNMATDATGGCRISLGGTAASSALWFITRLYNIVGDTLEVIDVFPTFGNATTGAGPAKYFATINGFITVSGTGTMTVDFAQSVSNGTSTVLAGSTLKVEEM